MSASVTIPRSVQIKPVPTRITQVPIIEGPIRAGKDRIISNREFDALLLRKPPIVQKSTYATGTWFAHEAPGVKLEAEIIYPIGKERLVVPVPKDYQGASDIILIFEHPDFSFKPKGMDIRIVSDSIAVLEGYPRYDGQYPVEAKYGIPYQSKEYSEEKRYLLRATGKLVSAVIRTAASIHSTGSVMLMRYEPSTPVDMLIEHAC